ncbi:MAG TPA: SAM-dependent methyltransferase, partial [Polyangiaceae bacterium]|nr:SAM-dependent methyltransferase [Polyangiaceae bacterium]
MPDHHTVTFGLGTLRVELVEEERFWVLGLGPATTADLLAEMVAALVYHYDPELGGGTALTDVQINDGDFAVRRRRDGSFELRLLAARAREGNIEPSLLLLYLVQLMAYEDWNVDGTLTGLPVLLGNPSVAFEGVARGLRYRYRDLGQPEERAQREAERWIHDFGRSREGRGYRPWVERFLAGQLPLSFGGDLRERWWRLMPVQTKLGVLELAGRHHPTSAEAKSARNLRIFIDRLAREIGRAPAADAAPFPLNDLSRDGWLQLLEEAKVPPNERAQVADELLAHWPYRSLDQLLAAVPGARALRRVKSRLSLGRVLVPAEEGTLNSLGPVSKEVAPSRALANAELFAVRPLPRALHAAASTTFLSFEQYMDAALHDPRWGYYAQRVQIGKAGHFDTHPEEHSPDYGQWLAAWAHAAWRDLVAQGELGATDPLPIIEFGAGNGRLARDFLDAVARWPDLAARVQYRIYEMSASLRDKQRELLGQDAQIVAGDARRPAAALQRDFPDGLRGLVLSNEVPDAFGVHKLLLGADGQSLVALVAPRIEPSVRDALEPSLAGRIEAANAAVRARFALVGNGADLYLDAATFGEVMSALQG